MNKINWVLIFLFSAFGDALLARIIFNGSYLSTGIGASIGFVIAFLFYKNISKTEANKLEVINEQVGTSKAFVGKNCSLFSTSCGADYWLEFNESDPPEYQALNGKCVVVVGGDENGLVETDECDPLGVGKEGMLWVSRDKLKREDNRSPANKKYEQFIEEKQMVVGQLAHALENVLGAKKRLDAKEVVSNYEYVSPEECPEYFELELAERHLVYVINKMASQEDE